MMPISSLDTPPTSFPSSAHASRRRTWLVAIAATVVLGALGVAIGARAGLSATRTEGESGGRSVTAPVANTQRVALHVEGMYCASCESTITAMLRRTPGVVRADVSVQRSEAVVVFDPTKTSPAKLVAVIQSLGYRASLRQT